MDKVHSLLYQHGIALSRQEEFVYCNDAGMAQSQKMYFNMCDTQVRERLSDNVDVVSGSKSGVKVTVEVKGLARGIRNNSLNGGS